MRAIPTTVFVERTEKGRAAGTIVHVSGRDFVGSFRLKDHSEIRPRDKLLILVSDGIIVGAFRPGDDLTAS